MPVGPARAARTPPGRRARPRRASAPVGLPRPGPRTLGDGLRRALQPDARSLLSTSETSTSRIPSRISAPLSAAPLSASRPTTHHPPSGAGSAPLSPFCVRPSPGSPVGVLHLFGKVYSVGKLVESLRSLDLVAIATDRRARNPGLHLVVITADTLIPSTSTNAERSKWCFCTTNALGPSASLRPKPRG